MSIAKIVGGEKPDWYGEINFAWFPKNEACEVHGIPSFEGYMNLDEAFNEYPETSGADWEILPVNSVEECVIHWPLNLNSH